MKMHRWFLPLLMLALLAAGCMSRAGDRPDPPPARDTKPGEVIPAADVHPADGTGAPTTSGDSLTAVATPVADAHPPVAVTAAIDTVPSVLSAPMSFRVVATALGKDVRLQSEGVSDLAGIACSEEAAGGSAMSVLRFAHYGRSDSPFIMNWVLFIPPGAGTISAVKVSGKTGGGYRVTLRGDLRFNTLLKGATMPIKLKARMTPEFVGISRTWPPRDVTLSLANGPVPFFADSAHAPLLTVSEADFVLGKNETKYFAASPKIIRAEAVAAGGRPGGGGGRLRLEWNGTENLVKPIVISGYNIYRSSTPSDPKSWRKIGAVGPGTTNFVDNDYDGKTRVAYAVTHRSEYSAGYQYEGVINQPYIVEPK